MKSERHVPGAKKPLPASRRWAALNGASMQRSAWARTGTKSILRIKEEDRMELKEKVEKALDKVRPHLKADGGNVELVDVTTDGIVKVKLTGACGGCPMSQMTLKSGIARVLKEEVPEVKDVVAA